MRVEIPPRVGQEGGVIAFCLETHDLVLSKCVAGRDRDWDFARNALEAGLVEIDELLLRIGDLPIGPPDQMHLRQMLEEISIKLDRT